MKSVRQDTAIGAAWLRRRGLARLVDGVLLVLLAVGVGAVTGFGLGWLLGTSLGVYVYFVAFDLAGATPGKYMLGLRVRSSDTERSPSIAQALRREIFVLAGAVPFLGPVLALVAWLTIARGIHVGGDGWHDRFAHTCVVPYP